MLAFSGDILAGVTLWGRVGLLLLFLAVGGLAAVALRFSWHAALRALVVVASALLPLAGCTWAGDGVPTPGPRAATRSTRGAIYASPPRLEIRAHSGLSGVAVVVTTVTTAAKWSASLEGADLPGGLAMTLLAPEGLVAGSGAVKARATWTDYLAPGTYRADVVVRTADGLEALRVPVVVTTEGARP